MLMLKVSVDAIINRLHPGHPGQAAVARARAPGTEKPSMPDRSQRATLGEPKKKTTAFNL